MALAREETLEEDKKVKVTTRATRSNCVAKSRHLCWPPDQPENW